MVRRMNYTHTQLYQVKLFHPRTKANVLFDFRDESHLFWDSTILGTLTFDLVTCSSLCMSFSATIYVDQSVCASL